MHIKCYHVCMCISHSFFFIQIYLQKKNKYTQFTPTFLLINTINKLFNTTIARIGENVTLAQLETRLYKNIPSPCSFEHFYRSQRDRFPSSHSPYTMQLFKKVSKESKGNKTSRHNQQLNSPEDLTKKNWFWMLIAGICYNT